MRFLEAFSCSSAVILAVFQSGVEFCQSMYIEQKRRYHRLHVDVRLLLFIAMGTVNFGGYAKVRITKDDRGFDKASVARTAMVSLLTDKLFSTMILINPLSMAPKLCSLDPKVMQ